MNQNHNPAATAQAPVKPLSPWTYTNAELFELEYDAFFLRAWQWVGHVSDVPEPGDFVAREIGRDSVFVIRGKDRELRAFQNVCRHRASRIVSGFGQCRGVIRCPYHGWTYRLDGSLLAIPQQEHFPQADLASLGLHEIELDVFHGLLFVRIEGDGPAVAEMFGESSDYFAKYGVDEYQRCFDDVNEVWPVNWKVAWDNYLENYHIPVGHPALQRLLVENDEYDEYASGVSYGTFEIRDKPSNVDAEREYQELFHQGCTRLPPELHGKWVQFGITGNLGIDLYPELLDIFQLVPLSADSTMVRSAWYGHPDPSDHERRLRELNLAINQPVNDEDRQLCTRVQLGLRTHNYRPGPLSRLEVSIARFHETVRRRIPVTSLDRAPAHGKVASENARLATSAAGS
ncbi:MAG: aromatic ring-hydroxylating dioxygenase subunit alpha [Gammaproteobacteria bacterium]|nr:aromatic ring-hydroxylating dioxygenase subunit alpha [Gammaproteobacteria bacterium]